MKHSKVVYTKVVADLFHYGHVNFLKSAKSLGDKLIVHVVDDVRVEMYKRKPIMTQDERLKVVESCGYVDKVVANGPKIITKKFMLENNYSIYAFSYNDDKELKIKMADSPDLPQDMIGLIKYTEGISTTDIITRIIQRNGTEKLL
jgi:cytidyltransferase-like protein